MFYRLRQSHVRFSKQHHTRNWSHQGQTTRKWSL